MRDLPVADKDVTLFVDTMQGYCSYCPRYITLRPEICHPSCGYTWRLMRILSRFLVHTSARFLEDEYAIPYFTILRLDMEVLENDIPKPKLKDVQGVLIDEKFLGSSRGFVTVCLNAATGEPLEMVRGKDSHCLDDSFNRFDEQQKRKIKYLGIDRSNAYKAAAIKRIQAKACGLFDERYLFLKLRQVYFLRLQRMHKTPRAFYQQI